MRSTKPALSRTTHSFGYALVCLLLGVVTSATACDREPGILVNIAAWPDGVERIRVRTTIGDARGTDIFLGREQTRFVVRVPAGSQGSVQIDGEGLDAVNCKLARGSLTEPVPENLSLFIERTLELSPLAPPVCGVFKDTINIPSGGSQPFSVAVGDFDGIGNQDLAIANANASSPSVNLFIGNGLGGFGNGIKLSNFSTPQSVTVGDFNGDMKLDLAVANYAGSRVSVLLGKDSGDFGTLSDLPVGPFPQSVAVGDFNGDMKLDLVSSNGGDPTLTGDPVRQISTVSVMLGDGMGRFSPATYFSAGATGAQCIAVGDFNGDMRQDLAVANAQSNNVSVLLGKGDGTFNPATKFSVGIAPYGLAVGDFNRDSYLDLATANYALDSNPALSSVSVLLGNGLGQFTTTLSLVVGQRSRALAVADFDGDQNPDLAVTNTGNGMVGAANVSLLFGNGRGDFSTPVNFKTGSSSLAIAVGDFNGDRRPDLAVTNHNSNNVSILLNQF